MNNNWHKKEKPLLGLTGLGGGVDGLAVVGAATKAYVDDVFSTYAYKGSGSARSINNGIDLSGKGGLVWTKVRDAAYSHMLNDTVRTDGRTHRISSDSNLGETNYGATGITAWNSNGYSLGTDAIGMINDSSQDYASWTFAKQEGFLDVVTWTGNGSNRTISHSLGSIPGCIMVKRTDTAQDWAVYHRGNGATKNFYLNSSGGVVTDSVVWNDTEPTSSVFSVGTHAMVNANGGSYVAYIFAGGASTAATARSVEFDSTWPGDDLKIAKNSDFQYGTGDFTWEAYVKPTDLSSSNRYVLNHVDMAGVGTIGGIYIHLSNQCLAYENASGSGDTILANRKIYTGQWTHVAVSRNSGITRLFQNGLLVGTGTHDDYSFPQSNFHVGINYSASGNGFDGNISNVRIIKGTGLYTSSFTPPTEPLTNVTNTVLLCCNNSSVTGSTVTPDTITSDGNTPTASTDNPFDDPNGFKFGEDSDKNIIKCGSYTGNGSTTGPEIFMDWEPQWILVKNAGAAANWGLLDSMRGIATDAKDSILFPDSNGAEVTSSGTVLVNLTSTGFKNTDTGNIFNSSATKYVYIAIRRPDASVGKSPEAASEVFAMDTGNASTTIPVWDSNFVVDFAMNRAPASTTSWYTTARLIQDYYVLANSTNGWNQDNGAFFDSNVGWAKDDYGTWGSTYQSWMWKRYPKGFDVMTYESPGGDNFQLKHNLGVVPEMMWIKRMTDDGGAYNWTVYHKGLNGGTNPENYGLHLNTNSEEVDDYGFFSDTAPTATHVTFGYDGTTGASGKEYLAMLFASITGISKCGYYDGSDSGQTITTGFQPRFIIIKCTTDAFDWLVFDTVRGWASGNDQRLRLNDNSAQNGSYDVGAPTSTGFTLTNPGDGSEWDWNDAGKKYIYYAHA